MPRADELRALLAKVEEAETGSRELNQRLFALGWGWSYPLHGAALSEFESIEREGLAGFSSSVDAAYSLIHRILPGWSWEVRRSGFGDPAQASLWNPREAQVPGVVSLRDHASGNPALALIAALLSALIAREAEHGR